MKPEKKRELIRRLSIFVGIIYVFLVCLILHVGWYADYERCSVLLAIWPGFVDIFIHPFRIFPILESTIIAIILMTGIFAVLCVFVYQEELQRRHYKEDEVGGNAKWFNELDEYNRKFTEPFGSTKHDGKNNMILSQDLFMSMDNKAIRRNMNVFIIGGSGSGKSYNFVGPNLMQANCSYVVTDPSGGLFKEYGHFFERQGYHVKCFNLSRMSEGNHYNPFHYIHSDKDVEILVTTLISNTTPPDKSGGDPFWEKSETALLVALIAYLYHYCDEEMQNFSSVMKLMRAADIDENDSSQKSQLDYIFDGIENEDPNSFAVKQYKTFKMGAGKTLKGILISCAVRLQAFDLEDVATLTDSDDIELDNVGDEKTALFVIIPTGDKTFNFLASMMYSQLFQRLYGYCENEAKYSVIIMDSDEQIVRTFRLDREKDPNATEEKVIDDAKAFFERAKKSHIEYNSTFHWYELRTEKDELVCWRGEEKDIMLALAKIRGGHVIQNKERSNNGERLPIHTRMLLDEFANIGKIPEFPEKVATIRKYEISVAIILQSLSQMKKMYKDEWEELSGNCDNAIYLGGGADQMSTEWISKLLGKETRIVMSTSPGGKGGGGMSLNRQGIELFAPDQLRTMDENDCIVLMKSQFAYKGQKYMSHLHPNRQEVLAHPNYVFNRNKATYLMSSMKNEYSVTNIIENFGHGEMEALTDDEKDLEEKINDNKKQQREEYKNNADVNGQMHIGESQDTRNPNGDVRKAIDNQDLNHIADSLMESTDDGWNVPVEDMDFGAKPASN